MTHFSKIDNLKHNLRHCLNNWIGLKVWPLTVYYVFILFMKHLIIQIILYRNDWQKKFMLIIDRII